MTKEIRLIMPDKEEFFKNIGSYLKVNWYEQIEWLVNSNLDVVFYRMDGDKKVNYTKEQMRIVLEQNWECRGKEDRETTTSREYKQVGTCHDCENPIYEDDKFEELSNGNMYHLPDCFADNIYNKINKEREEDNES